MHEQGLAAGIGIADRLERRVDCKKPIGLARARVFIKRALAQTTERPIAHRRQHSEAISGAALKHHEKILGAHPLRKRHARQRYARSPQSKSAGED